MNPLQFLYDTVDVIKDGKTGKTSLIYDKVGKQFYILKERDLKTAEIYKRLQEIKSPYLPEIYHAVEYDGKFFIVEEYIQGRTLYEILIHNNGLDEKKSAEVLKQICKALKILHAQKIIHRDIKPSNIMVTKNNSVKLIDFGIARIVKENRENDTNFLGTRGYAPPEQFGFGQTDSRSDIFSLGITIQKILGENYDGYLKNILAKCTELNPANRYQSVEEILIDIDKKYFRYKIKIISRKIILICAIILLSLFSFQKFLESDEMPVTEIKTESSVVEENPPQEIQSPPQKYESEKVEWSEIKIPDAENFSPPVQTTPQIFESDTSQKIKKSDPRLSRVCTLTLNNQIYNGGSAVEIPPNVWQTWKNDGESIYLPQNFSVNLKLENKNSAPLNVSVKADLNGFSKTKKIFPAITLASGEYKNFEIPIGGLACANGSFEVVIWLRTNDDTPLVSFWNGEKLSNNITVRIYLRDYNKLKYN